MEKDNHGFSRWFAGLYCMLIIFCLSASAKPCGKKRRALRRRDQALVGNYLSRRTGQWALWRESFSWNSHDCSCTSLQGLLMQGWPKPTALPAAPLAAVATRQRLKVSKKMHLELTLAGAQENQDYIRWRLIMSQDGEQRSNYQVWEALSALSAPSHGPTLRLTTPGLAPPTRGERKPPKCGGTFWQDLEPVAQSMNSDLVLQSPQLLPCLSSYKPPSPSAWHPCQHDLSTFQNHHLDSLHHSVSHQTFPGTVIRPGPVPSTRDK